MRKTLCSMLLFMAEACLAQQPSINANGVLDAASYTSGIAPGGLFVVRGSNLSARGSHSATLPLPTRLAGVSITFVPLSGAAGIEAATAIGTSIGAAAAATGAGAAGGAAAFGVSPSNSLNRLFSSWATRASSSSTSASAIGPDGMAGSSSI